MEGVERTASANASADVYCAGGVDSGGGTNGAVAGAETVVITSAVGTAADLGALGTV